MILYHNEKNLILIATNHNVSIIKLFSKPILIMSNIVTYLIIILSAIAVGMVMGLIFRPKYKYHGPNAMQESKKKYYNRKNNKCYQFIIKPLECPESKFQKLLNRIKN